MYKIYRTGKATQDIKKIAEYISIDNPNRALTFVQELLGKVSTQISQFPHSGKAIKSFHYVIYKNYLIFYKINDKSKSIYISHIENSANYSAYKKLL
jgi:toxin ParE1/3/4